MRFGNRVNGNYETLNRRRRAYSQHIDTLPFGPGDALYKYFVADVFHDCTISTIRLNPNNSTLKMTLRNHHALNEMSEVIHLEKHNFSIFDTKVKFLGVKHFSHAPKNEGTPYYSFSEIDRKAGLWRIKIFLSVPYLIGKMEVLFDRVEVEDISARLIPYLNGRDPESVLTHIRSPSPDKKA